jgi:hypothetical protein
MGMAASAAVLPTPRRVSSPICDLLMPATSDK